MGHPDYKGYYRILGISPKATAAAIKKTFRRRSKVLHPDHNRRLGAEVQFAALNEAYQVLSDPAARARYDTRELHHDAPGGDDAARDAGQPVACRRCREVTAQPRYVIFHQVIGEFVRVTPDRVQGVFCHHCARDVGLAATLLTWGIGWWGWPDGPLQTVRAIGCNARGGEFPRDANYRLLGYQARAFSRVGKAALGQALAREALALAPDGGGDPELTTLAGADSGPQLKPVWRTNPLIAIAHWAPAALLVIGFVVFVVRPGMDTPPPPAQVTPSAAPTPLLPPDPPMAPARRE